jgi:diphosphomevalonate decarboxylase
MKVTTIAHPMQALVKYHGLKDWKLRIPYHDSISVNMSALRTTTTIKIVESLEHEVTLNKVQLIGRELERVCDVIETVSKLSGKKFVVKIDSENSLDYTGAKALVAGLFKIYGLDWNLRKISTIARRFSGSASRSVVGGFAHWYAGHDDESSYAESIAGGDDLDLGIVIVPLSSEVRTEEAHKDVKTSPFFNARIKSAANRCKEMRKSIIDHDLIRVAQLAEIDSLELHALTMTGENGLVAYKPNSILLMSEIRKMRQTGLNAYFSMQTGPSVFINTYPEEMGEIQRWIKSIGLKSLISKVGGRVKVKE